MRHITFTSIALAVTFLAACVPGTQPAALTDRAYIGTWACDLGRGPTFVITENTYSVSGSIGRIAAVEQRGNSFVIILDDGYRASLLDVQTDYMTWHSPQSGDTFLCQRRR